jgi:uncharacterized protein (TIGR03118 family)
MFILRSRGIFVISALAMIAGCDSEATVTTPPVQLEQRVAQTNLVSDQAGVAAHTDPNLVNPWGIAFGPSSFFWIANNGTGTSTVYDANGAPSPANSPIVVTIPPPSGAAAGSTAAPTGIVFNDTSAFGVGSGGSEPSSFLFATEGGTIAGWNPTANPRRAFTTVDRSSTDAIYKGMVTAKNGNEQLLYATNFHAGTVDVFDADFNPVTTGLASNAFQDSSLPAGYAPFGIHMVEGNLFVTYAKQDANKEDDVRGAGNGFVDEYRTDGTLVRRFAPNGVLDAPWAVTLAPSDFGLFGDALLVGNFGDGKIHAFDLQNGTMMGTLMDVNGAPLVIDGLWDLVTGNGKNAGDASKLYFTAGPDDEQHGLFGSLATAP